MNVSNAQSGMEVKKLQHGDRAEKQRKRNGNEEQFGFLFDNVRDVAGRSKTEPLRTERQQQFDTLREGRP
jgi:hypothetical protein